MKRLIKTVKNLGNKAGHWQELVEQAPSKAERFRQALMHTTGQLQQLRADVQAGFHDLKADDDGRLMQVLAEIHDHADVLDEAGYEITGVDIELGIARRVIVQLEEKEEVPPQMISSLRARHPQQKALQALLNGLIQARELAGQVAIAGLPRFVVTVQLGSAPSIRIGWRPELAFDDEEAVPAPPVTGGNQPAPGATSPAKPPPLPDAMTSGFFARHEPPPAQPAPAPQVVAGPVTAATPANAPEATTTDRSLVTPGLKLTPRLMASDPKEADDSQDWRRSALDRFKKMPKL